MQAQPLNNSPIQPSYLRQIVDVVDAMSEEQQKIVLKKLKWQQILEHAKKVDEMLKSTPCTLTEEEIYEMCSQTRREMYEEKLKRNQA